jgi:methionyl-tRNA formyltransferase
MLLEALQDIESVLQRAEPQDDAAATYAPRLSKAQAEVDWNKPADRLLREIRAFNPWPVSFSYLQNDSIRLWSARASRAFEADIPGRVVAHDNHGVYVSCADAVLQVTELQFAGRKRCTAAQALGARNLSGCLLGKHE